MVDSRLFWVHAAGGKRRSRSAAARDGGAGGAQKTAAHAPRCPTAAPADIISDGSLAFQMGAPLLLDSTA